MNDPKLQPLTTKPLPTRIQLLPQELQDMILDHVLTHDHQPIVHLNHPTYSPPLALHLSSKVRRTFAPTYFSTTTFRLANRKFARWVSKLTPWHLTMMRNVQLSDPVDLRNTRGTPSPPPAAAPTAAASTVSGASASDHDSAADTGAAEPAQVSEADYMATAEGYRDGWLNAMKKRGISFGEVKLAVCFVLPGCVGGVARWTKGVTREEAVAEAGRRRRPRGEGQ